MAIDTELQGQPEQVRVAGQWLAGPLATRVDGGVDTMLACRTSAEGDWDGSAGAAFAECMLRGATKAQRLHTDATRVGQVLVTYAAELKAAQQAMAGIRNRARAVGLEVNGYVVVHPGLGPPFPGAPPTPLTPPEMTKMYWEMNERHMAHSLKLAAYEEAAAECEEVREQLALRQLELFGEAERISASDWVFSGASIAVGLRGAARQFNAAALRGTAKQLEQAAQNQVMHARTGQPLPGQASQFYKDLDDAQKTLKGVDDLKVKAEALDDAAKAKALKGGGLLAGAGVAYEIANGKDPVQATAAGTAGSVASVGTAALVGGTIGSAFPVVGTVVGVVVGTGVGIVAANVVDQQFEKASTSSKEAKGTSRASIASSGGNSG